MALIMLSKLNPQPLRATESWSVRSSLLLLLASADAGWRILWLSGAAKYGFATEGNNDDGKSFGAFP